MKLHVSLERTLGAEPSIIWPLETAAAGRTSTTLGIRDVRLVRSALAAICAVSAYLRIVVQPIFAGTLLPVTGGHPYIWHATQCAFQALLIWDTVSPAACFH